jgi:hypothetical protein
VEEEGGGGEIVAAIISKTLIRVLCEIEEERGRENSS